MIKRLLLITALLAATILNAQSHKRSKIEHIVIVYMENRSFDNLFYGFNGADNAKTPKKPYAKQIDENGSEYKSLPMGEAALAAGIPEGLQNKPFLIDRYISQDAMMPDLVHRFYQNIEQINGGKNDAFVQVSDAKGLSMGYHDSSRTALWRYAKEYTLCDNFFAAAFGGSFLNHQWLIAARTPKFADANLSKISKYELSKEGKVLRDGILTPDGYAVNTIQPFSMPYKVKHEDNETRLPAQTHDTIGDRLSGKGISWAWYSGGYDEAMSGRGKEVNYQYHHNPFVYFKNYGVGAKGRAHLKDEKEFFVAIKNGSLPKVSFFKPAAADNQHPGYASLLAADKKIEEIVESIKKNKKIWRKTVIVITYDENGGLWDHAAPPVVDRWGPGPRTPAVVVSPFAKRGFIDHTVYDTTSILRFLEWKFELAPLSDRDKKANNLANTLKL